MRTRENQRWKGQFSLSIFFALGIFFNLSMTSSLARAEWPKTLLEQLQEKPILEKISRAYQNDILRQTLTTVDYKMVDEYSFPYFLAAGAVLKWTGDYVEEGENMPFINAGVPPYKLLPYLDPAEVNSLKAP